VCGASSGFKTVLVYIGGNAGGVRGGIVAVGNCVSVGKGVGVIKPAIAVWIAWVITMFISEVGDAGVLGWHAVKITVSRPKLRKMRES